MSVNPIASSSISVSLGANAPLESAGSPSAPSKALAIDAAHAHGDFRSQSLRLSARISELERDLIAIDRRSDELDAARSAADGGPGGQERSELQERRAAIGAQLANATAQLSTLTSGAKDSGPLDPRRAAELLRMELFRGR